MIIQTLTLGLLAGLIHFVIVGILYGNPFIDQIYQKAQKSEAGVRKWPSKGNYLFIQFLGTQIEVYILTFGFLWLHPLIQNHSDFGTLLLGLFFAVLRVYPRFWNMWIQSTYPKQLLLIEVINGVISTLSIIYILQFTNDRFF